MQNHNKCNKLSFKFLRTVTLWCGEDPVIDPVVPPVVQPVKETYTKAEFDSHSAKQRKLYEAKEKDLATKLEKLANDSRTTQEERDQYLNEANEIRGKYTTAEELKKQEIEKLKKTHNETYTKLESEHKMLKQKHTSMVVRNELVMHLSPEEHVSGQLIKLFTPDASLTEELGEDAKPTGNQVVVVDFDDSDKDGKPVRLKLTVPQLVKRIKELPERFGNMIKGAGAGGLGGTNKNSNSSGRVFIKDTDAYMDERRKRNAQNK